MPTPTDEVRICKDCRNNFTFSVRDQEFFAKMNFTPPVRCKPCRDKRKAEKAGAENGSRPNGGNNRPLGVSASNPIREYRNRPEMGSPREVPPLPSRDDKNDGRRRRNRHRNDSGDSDW